jgi:hypothetical protein
MVRHRCGICKRYFSTPGGLRQHANALHHGRTSLSQTHERIQQRPQQLARPEHDASLWGRPITRTLPPETIMTSSSSTSTENLPSQVDSDNMEDVVFEEVLDDSTSVPEPSQEVQGELRYNLRSQAHQAQNIEIEENAAEDSETELHLPMNLDEPDFDVTDIQGASLDDALDTIEGKNKPERVAEWPNDAYREFMELVIKGNISNKIGDKIIKFFNKHSNLETSPLPKSTKNGKDYINQINSPSTDFKEKVVATYSDVGLGFELA